MQVDWKVEVFSVKILTLLVPKKISSLKKWMEFLKKISKTTPVENLGRPFGELKSS